MKQELKKLISSLDKVGITTSVDRDSINYHFSRKDKRVSISSKIIYRESGIATVRKDGDKPNEVLVIEVDDNMFYNSYLKQIILYHFKED